LSDIYILQRTLSITTPYTCAEKGECVLLPIGLSYQGSLKPTSTVFNALVSCNKIYLYPLLLNTNKDTSGNTSVTETNKNNICDVMEKRVKSLTKSFLENKNNLR
jgi:hypothetical protein